MKCVWKAAFAEDVCPVLTTADAHIGLQACAYICMDDAWLTKHHAGMAELEAIMGSMKQCLQGPDSSPFQGRLCRPSWPTVATAV